MTDSYEKHTPKFLDTLNLDGRITFLNESRVYILLHSYLNVLNKKNNYLSSYHFCFFFFFFTTGETQFGSETQSVTSK